MRAGAARRDRAGRGRAANVAGARRAAHRLRRLGDQLPRAVLDRRLQPETTRPGRGADAIYYELRRRKIEIPCPIQVEYSREEAPADTPERRERFRQAIAAVPVLASLPAEAHRALAAAAAEQVFADGEVIVREGEPGGSMFIVCRGKVAITIGPERREVAVTEAGGYFGEMSLLTGEPRTATVVARGDCTVLEIGADAFRAYVKSHPDVIDRARRGRRRAPPRARRKPRGRRPRWRDAGSHSAQRMRGSSGSNRRRGRLDRARRCGL